MGSRPITKQMIEEKLQTLKNMQRDCENYNLVIRNYTTLGLPTTALRNLGYFKRTGTMSKPNYICTVSNFEPIHARLWIEEYRKISKISEAKKAKNKVGRPKKNDNKKQKPIKTMLKFDGKRKYRLRPVTIKTCVISHYQLQIKKLFGWRNVNGFVFSSIQDFNSKITIVNPKQIKLN